MSVYLNKQIEEMYESLPMGIVLCTTGCAGEIVYSNSRADEMLKPEALGEALMELSAQETEKEIETTDSTGRAYTVCAESKLISTDNGGSLMQICLSDITSEKEKDRRLIELNDKLQYTIDSIQGGVAVYRISDIVETVYFSEGLPTMTGYTSEEYNELIKHDAADMIYPADRDMVMKKVFEIIESGETVEFEFRKQHKNGSIVWVRTQAKVSGEKDGCPLIHCIFNNISEFKQTKQELEHIVNSIPGGIGVCQITESGVKSIFFSDGAVKLLGYKSREEYYKVNDSNVGDVIFEDDREKTVQAVREAVARDEGIALSFRAYHKNKSLIWVHVCAKRMGGSDDAPTIYAVITGMSEEGKLYRSIANEAAGAIYVIKQDDYELLYANESIEMFMSKDDDFWGKKCYQALHGKDEPCEFCTIAEDVKSGTPHEMYIPEKDRTYMTKTGMRDWNGVASFVKYVTDITDDKNNRRAKERMEQYYQTLLNNFPGGLVVLQYEDGRLYPEFISDDFAAMLGMKAEEVIKAEEEDEKEKTSAYGSEAAGQDVVKYIQSGRDKWDKVFKLISNTGEEVWISAKASILKTEDGGRKIYAVCTNISEDVRTREESKRLYSEMLGRHYTGTSSDEIISAYCNVTKDRIMDVDDATGSDLTGRLGTKRNEFFLGISRLIPDENERRAFCDVLLNKPMREAFERKETANQVECFIKLPVDKIGRYVHVDVAMVTAPDSEDLMGFLSVKDITDEKLSQQLYQGLSSIHYEFVAQLDLLNDKMKLLSVDTEAAMDLPLDEGLYSEQVAKFIKSAVLPKDRKMCAEQLTLEGIKNTLDEKGPYSIHYSLTDEKGRAFTKNLLIFYVNRDLQRVCLARVDVTDSVDEQQNLLSMLAYTFDMMGILDRTDGSFTMHTKDSVVDGLAPHVFADYDEAIKVAVSKYCVDEERENLIRQLSAVMVQKRLEKEPDGYDIVTKFELDGKIRYKQYTILWGDDKHDKICIVRADVTDAIMKEQKSRDELAEALLLAEEANKAKTDFLSAMSHDIRTPMNAIMGMVNLALADRENPDQIDESLSVIRSSSEHLLRLINDILDMSRIESGRMILTKEPFDPKTEMDIAAEQTRVLAEKKNINFRYSFKMKHDNCMGDILRIHQILDNILGNAVKFTPEGGTIYFSAREIPDKSNDNIVWHRFTIEDNGIGISEENIGHIFDSFYRTEDPTISRTEGSGLGLSIVKRIIDYKGGTIDVKSQPGKGTRFMVEIPIHLTDDQRPEPQVKESQSEIQEKTDLSGIHILVVEDNEINRMIAIKLLENVGAVVDTAENGQEGFDKFYDSFPGTFDMILMDIQMPVLDGYEATRAIRNCVHPQAMKIPIIAMTANVFAADVRKCLDAGMDAHISKPIDTRKMYRLIEGYWNAKKG